ncbi:hypothetical protein MHYP_G00017950 [Metynnis hypsauchen]
MERRAPGHNRFSGLWFSSKLSRAGASGRLERRAEISDAEMTKRDKTAATARLAVGQPQHAGHVRIHDCIQTLCAGWKRPLEIQSLEHQQRLYLQHEQTEMQAMKDRAMQSLWRVWRPIWVEVLDSRVTQASDHPFGPWAGFGSLNTQCCLRAPCLPWQKHG